MCTVEKFCCCCSLGAGVFLISVWNLASSFLIDVRRLIRGFILGSIGVSYYSVDNGVQLVLTVLCISSILAIIAVLSEKRTLLIPAIVCDFIRVCSLLLMYLQQVLNYRYYDNTFAYAFLLVLYSYFVVIEVSYYQDLKRRKDAVILGVGQGPAFSSLPQYSVEQYPAQIYVPQVVADEYRTPAPYAHVQPQYTSPMPQPYPQMPQAYPQMMPTPVFGYAEQSQTNATAPPFPYGAPPPYAPVQNASTNEKPVV